jgi:hypothetical protein
MDKRKVIEAYRRGFITIQECAQIIGVEGKQLAGLMNEAVWAAEAPPQRPESAAKSL